MNDLFLFAGEYNTVRGKNCEGQDHDDFVSRNGERQAELGILHIGDLTLSNPIFLPPTAYSPALICFGRERVWWITCNYPTVLKEKNMEKQKEYNLRYLLAKFRTT
jgi:hypothetical protein